MDVEYITTLHDDQVPAVPTAVSPDYSPLSLSSSSSSDKLLNRITIEDLNIPYAPIRDRRSAHLNDYVCYPLYDPKRGDDEIDPALLDDDLVGGFSQQTLLKKIRLLNRQKRQIESLTFKEKQS